MVRRILVADAIAEDGLAKLRAAPGLNFDVRQGLSPAQLGEVVGDYDGMLIRSAVKVTKEALVRPGRLSVIARAGVGVDNVDLDAATAAGVLVLNTPDANTLSTAEHTLALMMALHRQIPAAHQHVVSGQWSRGTFSGDQLAGKTLGVVGFGRIGRAVAKRAQSFEMRVLVFDPFVTEETARELAVTRVPELIDLLAASDVITLHATLSDTTKHMIGPRELAAMKPTAKLVNCARGALVDEAALAEALNAGRLGGAALDVYEQEPPKNSPILGARNVVLTPHLAASTAEAQARVSVDAVDAILAYLLRGEIQSAVNVTGLPASLSPRARAFVDLCNRLGAILSAWCAGGVEKITVTAYGEGLQELAGVLAWQSMVAVVGPHLSERLTLVNAKTHAKSRGIVVEHAAHSQSAGLPESVVIRAFSRGEKHEIEGTVYAEMKPRVLSIDGYRMEMIPERTIVLIFNDDRPGVIGLVGQTVGDARINIADMALSRRGKTALMVLKLDEPLPSALREQLRSMNPPILSVQSVTLAPISDGTTAI